MKTAGIAILGLCVVLTAHSYRGNGPFGMATA